MALSADTSPHYTTIADFISSNSNEIIDLFTRILSVCYTQNLIGKNMFAIDGCKISSNCSKEWSGTKKELLGKAGKIEKAARYLVTKHKEADKNKYNKSQEVKEKESIKKLKVWAEAFGDINESGHLPEILEEVDKNCREAKISKKIYDEVVVTTDSGFHSEKNTEVELDKRI